MVRIARVSVRILLGGFLVFTGLSHLFWARRGFQIAVPDWAPRATGLDKDAIVVSSGVVEIMLGGALVALPRERRTVGALTAAFFVAVFPGNVHHWRTGRSAPLLRTDRARFIRLFLQPVLIAWALWSAGPWRHPASERAHG
ncbi:DoxX family protein [Microbacterium hominis]|uniref:DoxX family membrane protein n=1 Tax=Microbacterium hominis TaxID=162426 RepID=A0A7D4U9W4_9MICO|nr:hypothetical protein [Microbacterium hominis]QKJ21006.1 hypothetical protein HQM25_00680 [Microbacterium hominis]